MKILSLQGREVAIIQGDTHISRWVRKSGRLDHDQNMLPLLDPYIKEGDVVIDAGAFIGDHTEYYANRVGPTGMVYAFEPFPTHFECLVFNMKDHRQVSCFNYALGAESGYVDITTAPNAGASRATNGTTIPKVTIDSLKFTRVDFIKLDIEGWEPDALKGMEETITESRPKMLIEINTHALRANGYEPEHVFASLIHHGYTLRNIYAEQPMEGPQYDILALP